jgi:hypothetical protein
MKNLRCGRLLLSEDYRDYFWHTKYQNVKLPLFFGTSFQSHLLTTAFLAYQMP